MNNYDTIASRYDSIHDDPRSNKRFSRIERTLCQLIQQSSSVLDMGCGTGRLYPQSCNRYLGIDLSFEMLKLAQKKYPRGNWVQADLKKVPCSSGSFDLIFAAKGSCRYVPTNSFFEESFRVLSPGGKLVFHQYISNIWTWNRTRKSTPANVWDVQSVFRMSQEIVRRGFSVLDVELFRPLRFYPYVVRIPQWFRGYWASHVLFICEKPHV